MYPVGYSVVMYTVRQTEEFVLWLDDLEDKRAQVRIAARLRQVETGNLGDWQPTEGDVSELRVDFGPGYRLYVTRRGRIVIVMLRWRQVVAESRHPPCIEARSPIWRRSMTKTKAPAKLVAFDAARYLDDDEAIAEYITAILEANDPDLLLLALSDVARAKGMTQVAKDAGLGRESLYKALAPGAKPRFETVMKVARALGVKFTAQPV